MSAPLPPASSEPESSEPTPSEPKPPGRLRGRVIAGVVAAVTFAAGIGIGVAASQGEDEPEQPAAASSDDGDTAALEEQVATLQRELAQVTAERDGLQASVTELEAAAAAAAAAPPATAPPATTPPVTAPPAAEPPAQEPPAETPPAADGPLAGETYPVGQYEFADVQVSDDGIGGFALRARVTNTGDAVAGAIWTATLFLDGMVVATLDGSAQNFAAGATVTAEFFSLDPFGDYDAVEFQVDGQY